MNITIRASGGEGGDVYNALYGATCTKKNSRAPAPFVFARPFLLCKAIARRRKKKKSMIGGGSSSHFARTICSICYEDLKPTAEDLQSISVCGHVFHDIWYISLVSSISHHLFLILHPFPSLSFLSLQQWLEYSPAGKKSSCPVCKHPCSRNNLCRLYFQSIGGEPTQYVSSRQPLDEASADAEELREKVRLLESKLSGVNCTCELQRQQLMQLSAELVFLKERAKKEELLKDDALKEKAHIQDLLQIKTEELARTSAEGSRLKDRSMALAKELASLKLVSDVNLEEEEVVKLASVGGGADKEQTIAILKRSLVLRNNVVDLGQGLLKVLKLSCVQLSYRELMTQCNLLGRGESRSLKKLEKAEEKIFKLRARLQELERATEEKDNKALRAMRTSYRTAEIVHQRDGKEMSNSSFVGRLAVENKMGKTADFVSNSQIHFGLNDNCSLCVKETREIFETQKGSVEGNVEDNDDVIDLDLETDHFFMLNEDVSRPSITHDSGVCRHDGNNMIECLVTGTSTEHGNHNEVNRATDDVMHKTCRDASAGTLLPDIIQEDVLLPLKQESSRSVEKGKFS
ncbi:hypothetical protein ACLOJK_033996 [Asimina triloba]